MDNQPSDPDNPVMWSLTNASGDQLECDTHCSEAGLHLRFRSKAGILRLSHPLDASSVDSWSRIWRAYYLTSGWSDAGGAPRRHRPRIGRTPAPPVWPAGVAEQRDARVHSVGVPEPKGAILRCWTASGPDGSAVACDLVRTDAGLQVRCDTSPVRARLVQSMAEGLDLANAWKAAYNTPGGPNSGLN